jgi:putative Mg2+ transporter-C (MgtC) family protein
MDIIDPMTGELLLRLFISVGLGALVGFERELTDKPAGIRTYAFVSMGACLFTISSFYLIPSESISGEITSTIDVARIAAGIVTGIGFIGAGSIIATRGHVKGITTAASLWVVSAIGLLVGLGSYVLSIISAILIFVLLRLGKLERNI